MLAIVLAPAVSPRPALSGTVMAGVPVMVMGVAAVASWLPARRGCRIDPALALKQGSGC